MIPRTVCDTPTGFVLAGVPVYYLTQVTEDQERPRILSTLSLERLDA